MLSILFFQQQKFQKCQRKGGKKKEKEKFQDEYFDFFFQVKTGIKVYLNFILLENF